MVRLKGAGQGYEGQSITANLLYSGKDAVGATVYYQLSGTGITANDFAGFSLTGSSRVNALGSVTLNLPLALDSSTEGEENFSIQFYTDASRTVTAGKAASLKILDESKSVNTDFSLITWPKSAEEGSSISATLFGGKGLSGSTVYYQISGSGITSTDLSVPLTGSYFINSDKPILVTIPIAADTTTEGDETFTIQFYSDAARTLFAGNPAYVTVLDTSKGADNVLVFDTDTEGKLLINGAKRYLGSTGNDTITGTTGDDLIYGNAGDDKLYGTAGNDFLSGLSGNDTLDGGDGADTVILSGTLSNYYISYNRALGTATISDKRTSGDGTDSLKSNEKLQFSDKTFELINPPFTSTPPYGKTPSFLFDSAYYLLKNPELIPSVSISNAFDHYLKNGASAGKVPNTWFDPVYYANKWSDLKPLNLDAATLFMHYNLYGVWEGRSAGPTFDKYDGNRYLKDNPDVAVYVDAYVKDFLGSRVNGAIAHYIIYGANESRTGYDSNGQAIDQVILVGTPI
jgi:Ca2+-binding RTX toxin-like protein